MSVKHDYLLRTRSEIACFDGSDKVFSLKPSGLVGLSPELSFNAGALTNYTSAPALDPEVKITKLGRLHFLDFAGTVGNTGTMSANAILSTTVAVPAAYRPKVPFTTVIVCAVNDHGAPAHAGRTVAQATLGTDGILVFAITWGAWQFLYPGNGYTVEIEPFTLPYIVA